MTLNLSAVTQNRLLAWSASELRERRGMPHVLKVSFQTTIYNLADGGWLDVRPARETWVNRENYEATVEKRRAETDLAAVDPR
jgi:hypothetical protein